MIAIAAMSENRAIGKNGKIPWRLSDDFKWFKDTTMGGLLIMGRTTFESIGKPLPGRETAILTRKPCLHGPPFERCGKNVIELLDLGMLADHPRFNEAWLCGGAQVYAAALPMCKSLYLTRVHDTYEGDTFMPEFERLFPVKRVISEHTDYLSGTRFTIEHHTIL